jgi:translation initiation factor 3 subunit H
MVESIDMASIRSQALENINLEGLDPDLLSIAKLSKVEVDALVILDIQEHLKVVSPASATGQLLGLDIKDKLEITQSFGLDVESESSQEFQKSMLMTMKQLNYDANTVGWYTTTWLGSYWNLGLIETQFSYQNTVPQAVLLIYDPASCQTGKFNLLALRLTESFMAEFESGKFGMAEMAGKSIYDVFESIPIFIKNAHLLEPESKNVIQESGPNYPPLEVFKVSNNGNELDVEEYLKYHFEFMGDCLDEYGHEAWKWQGWSRAMGKDQSKSKRNVDVSLFTYF